MSNVAGEDDNETYSEEETVRRREAAIKVMLNTPKARKRTRLTLTKTRQDKPK